MTIATKVLKKYFGYDQFRPGQEEIVESIINGRDVLAILPTGGGKSICFQVPALALGSTTIVVSPLISLMKDQIENLHKRNISATYINSSLTDEEQEQRLVDYQAGKYSFVYVSPEKLRGRKFREISKKVEIKFIAIDEAHCLSMWGHDFRPAYLEVEDFVYEVFKNKKRPVMAAYTATATNLVIKDILENSGLKEPLVVQKSFARPNLHIKVKHCLDRHHKLLLTLRLLKKHKEQCGIIYVLTRRRAEQLTKILNHYIKHLDIGEIAFYHGGQNSEERSVIQERFLSGEIPIIIATNAFGMGVDKPNVRFVIHDQMSSNLENYYQEIGRGGRDGEVADCYLLYLEGDLRINQRFIDNSKDAFPEQIETLNLKLRVVEKYVAEYACRQQAILNYFDEKCESGCGHCDFCLKDTLATMSEEKQTFKKLLTIRNLLADQQHLIPSSVCTKLSLAYVAALGVDSLGSEKMPGLGTGFRKHYLPFFKEKLGYN
ncbi:MAG: ATP-dependent DNA helicase [Pseudomonadales bacterium]|jgi:ATP-dependent DNA helicase RecQ|nr:ATP-dependent DNA helicase [Pseudomonadales bacterium]